jgi:DNA polymerase-3 subunit delta'
MPFDDFPYQERAVRQIRAMLESGTFAGTFLVHGPGGVGEIDLVKTMAKGLFCPEKIGDYCGSCRDCLRIDHGTFPDLHWLEPERADYTIQQIRDLQQRAAQKPYGADLQMFVLKDADRMNPASGNALLKLLEEPNKSTILVLITASSHALLPTILSRCRKIRLSPLTPEMIAKRLEQEGVAKEEAEKIARVAGGKLEATGDLFDGRYFEGRIAWLERIAEVRRGTDFDALALASEVGSWKREDVLEYLGWMAGILRDALIIRHSVDSDSVVHAYAADRIEEIFEGMDERTLIALFEEMVETRRRIRGNANIELAMGSLIVRLLPARSRTAQSAS